MSAERQREAFQSTGCQNMDGHLHYQSDEANERQRLELGCHGKEGDNSLEQIFTHINTHIVNTHKSTLKHGFFFFFSPE
jgi:hypothetical protein